MNSFTLEDQFPQKALEVQPFGRARSAVPAADFLVRVAWGGVLGSWCSICEEQPA